MLKDGKISGDSVYAYNNALWISDFESDDKLDFIVRPDGGSNPPVIPEPVSSILFLSGGATLGFRLYRKRKKQKA